MSLPEGDRDVRLAADSQGRCCLLAGDELLFFDRDGKALGKTDMIGKTITRIACGGDGNVYLYEKTAEETAEVIQNRVQLYLDER